MEVRDTSYDRICWKIYTYLWFWVLLEVGALGKVPTEILFFSVLIIIRLESQSKFQMAAILLFHVGTPMKRFHTGLCKCLRNISTNIWSLGKRTSLELREVSYFLSCITSQVLSFSHSIVFDLFFYCVTVKTIYRAFTFSNICKVLNTVSFHVFAFVKENKPL